MIEGSQSALPFFVNLDCSPFELGVRAIVAKEREWLWVEER
ncbi:hypothetical protein [Paenibacillus eucommiae]|uniref:Uncharacterized protein n=1 Tax=Paenibacillus eucommiae TaxID=1355755 RepID=A0ABS4JCB0_9BACL|nr:hypothetical protein [Paenibacillus eucommiae]MBP1996374.1 hypothetical protein [Paenibacillus eucommiae]